MKKLMREYLLLDSLDNLALDNIIGSPFDDDRLIIEGQISVSKITNALGLK
jgi:hypothetical protein